MKKRIIEISLLAGFILLLVATNYKNKVETVQYNPVICKKTSNLPFKMLKSVNTINEEQEEIRNEIFYGELEEVAILVQAEAGNQDELGQRYVADVVFNRVDDKLFPDDIHDVIYQENPIQFATTVDGAMGKAGYEVTEEIFQLVLDEYEHRTNSDIIYFRTGRYSECGKPAFKHGNHYFSTRS